MSLAKPNIAVVGVGRMGAVYAKLVSERTDARLVAVVGNTPKKVEEVARATGARAYSGGDVDALLKNHPELDAFILSTPEWVRMEGLRKLLPMGKSILIEKPLVTSMDDLAELDRQSREHHKHISVVHSLRFSPRFSQAKRAIDAGQVGEIRHMYARRNGCLKSVQRVLGKTPLAFWLTCHDIDLMRWFTGSEVEWVLATTRSKLKSEDDYLIVHLHFKNGVDAVEEISWCSPPLSPTAPGCVFSVKGTEGMLEVADWDMNVLIYRGEDRVQSPDTYELFEIGGQHYGALANMIDHWVKGVRQGGKPFVSYEDGRAAVSVCDMIERSVQTGKIVHAGT